MANFLVLLGLAIGGFILGGILSVRRYKTDPLKGKVIAAIGEYFLDEKSFTVKNVATYLDEDESVVARYLEQLADAGMISRVRGKKYRAIDPLVFLTERDLSRARRITKNDNILYGAYQNPYLTHYWMLLIYLIVFVVVGILALVYADVSPVAGGMRDFIEGLPGGIDVNVFLLFMLMMSVILVDALDNVIKAYAREKYSVIVGEMSGVSFDRSYSDELSGRVMRGEIRDIDLEIRPLLKILNYFLRVPRGDVKIKIGKSKKSITFTNMPFPREMFFVLRSLQLASLAWRKRHAKTLLMWRSRTPLMMGLGGGK